jgi:hypothetical protein
LLRRTGVPERQAPGASDQLTVSPYTPDQQRDYHHESANQYQDAWQSGNSWTRLVETPVVESNNPGHYGDEWKERQPYTVSQHLMTAGRPEREQGWF